MKSRLLSNLDAAIEAAAPQTIRADCLRAERAALLARQGQQDEARTVIAALQEEYSVKRHPAVSGWIALAEGLLSYFTDMGRAAHDKLLRAHALGVAARDVRLHALASAWLALMDYANSDVDAMGAHVAEALHLAAADHHGARARACLVVALAYHFGDRLESAQPWYAKARLHANAEGDETMLSAIMYNMAGLLTDQSRKLVLTGESDPSIARRAMLSLESARNFDKLIGSTSLGSLVPLHRARLNSLQGHWAEAVALYEAHFSDGLLQGLERMRAWLGADLAWCRLQLGQTEQALKSALAAEVAVEQDRDLDDRAAAHSRLAQVFAQLGRADVAARHSAQAAVHWRTHEHDQALTIAAIDKALAKTGA